MKTFFSINSIDLILYTIPMLNIIKCLLIYKLRVVSA